MSKKTLEGKVIKDKNNKTIVVLVKSRYSHPFFKKVITSSKKYHAHDEKNKFKKDLFNFRFQKINSQITNPAKIGETKKSIARLKTILKGKINA